MNPGERYLQLLYGMKSENEGVLSTKENPENGNDMHGYRLLTKSDSWIFEYPTSGIHGPVTGRFGVLVLGDDTAPMISCDDGPIMVLDPRAVIVGGKHGYFYDPRNRSSDFPKIDAGLQEWMDENHDWPIRAGLFNCEEAMSDLKAWLRGEGWPKENKTYVRKTGKRMG